MASRTYICAMTGASGHQFDAFAARHDLTGLAARRPGPSPLAVPVTGQINGRPWRTAIDFTEAADLMRHLGTAAFVVAAYLTGMRVAEVLGLRSGCCPDPAPDEAGWHLIRGREYKTATDDDGNHDSAGVERDVPWVALCHREGVKDTPSLHRCVPGCANMIRTDHHARQLRDRADALDKQAAHAPQPVAGRLRAAAGQLRGRAEHHDRTRTVLGGAGQ